MGIKTIVLRGVLSRERSLLGVAISRLNAPSIYMGGQAKSSGTLSRSTVLRTMVRDYLVTISRSSTSNTNVAPGLIVGGAPLSP